MDSVPNASRSGSETTDAAPAESATLFVCVTCKGKALEGEEREGRRLHEALVAARQTGTATTVVPVECLSNCNRGLTVALTGPGRWTYVYGDLALEAAPDIIAFGDQYAATADGLVPWKERPALFKKGVIARVPPAPVAATPSEESR